MAWIHPLALTADAWSIRPGLINISAGRFRVQTKNTALFLEENAYSFFITMTHMIYIKENSFQRKWKGKYRAWLKLIKCPLPLFNIINVSVVGVSVWFPSIHIASSLFHFFQVLLEKSRRMCCSLHHSGSKTQAAL